MNPKEILEDCYKWLLEKPPQKAVPTTMNLARNYAWQRKSMLYPDMQRLAWYLGRDDRFKSYVEQWAGNE